MDDLPKLLKNVDNQIAEELIEQLDNLSVEIEQAEKKHEGQKKAQKMDEEGSCRELYDAAREYFRLSIEEAMAAELGVDVSREEGAMNELDKRIMELEKECNDEDLKRKAEDLIKKADKHRKMARSQTKENRLKELLKELESLN